MMAAVEHHKNLAILVGGGPAPGINSVIGAATIRARLEGIEVLGVRDGFEWIMQGDIDHVMPLTIDAVSRIHFRGGSHIGIARANPTSDPALLEKCVMSLLRLNVTQLITIGGDDTAFSAMKLEQRAAGRIHVVHVPKTIDNDLDLPPHVDTFGFQTARHYGVDIVKNLMVDAKTTSRWYFVIAMGRKAGHLALGIGKAAGATLTLIPEEFPKPIRLKSIVDTLVGAIIKRMSYGRRDGVAMIAEGVVLDVADEDLAGLDEVERDAHGHLRIAEVNLGEILKAQVNARLKTVRDQDDDGREERRVRAAVRRSHPVRHGVHARPRLLRREIPPVGRERRHDLDSGRPLRADSIQSDDGSGDRPDAAPPGRRRLHALRDRAAVHDPPATGRLRGSARAREAGRHGPPVAPGFPARVRVPDRQRTAAASRR